MDSDMIISLRDAWKQKDISIFNEAMSSNTVVLDDYGTFFKGINEASEVVQLPFSKLMGYSMTTFEIVETVSVSCNTDLVFIESLFEKQDAASESILLLHTCIIRDTDLVFYQFDIKSQEESLKNSGRNVYVSTWCR